MNSNQGARLIRGCIWELFSQEGEGPILHCVQRMLSALLSSGPSAGPRAHCPRMAAPCMYTCQVRNALMCESRASVQASQGSPDPLTASCCCRSSATMHAAWCAARLSPPDAAHQAAFWHRSCDLWHRGERNGDGRAAQAPVVSLVRPGPLYRCSLQIIMNVDLCHAGGMGWLEPRQASPPHWRCTLWM